MTTRDDGAGHHHHSRPGSTTREGYPMNITFPRLKTRSAEDDEKVDSPSTKMAVALGRVKRPGEVYGGTVGSVERATRRARGKRQRAARRAARR
jgi:hypothetical protein